jgi:hypothetical protein
MNCVCETERKQTSLWTIFAVSAILFAVMHAETKQFGIGVAVIIAMLLTMDGPQALTGRILKLLAVFAAAGILTFPTEMAYFYMKGFFAGLLGI